ISKLDAGTLNPDLTEFPISHVIQRLETTFANTAREKGLALRMVQSSLWVRSDVIFLERILLNLISNALRYTHTGGVIVGCRRRGGQLRIDVIDSGPGIPEEERGNIFGEFYRIPSLNPAHQDGLGLGLAIVQRLCRLLDHPIELSSTIGKGCRFSVTLPVTPVKVHPVSLDEPLALIDGIEGKLIVVIDDDALVLESMLGLLQSWNCSVVTADSKTSALERLTKLDHPPDLIISDYSLSGNITGIAAIEQLRGSFRAAIPAFLISGDISPERIREARGRGYYLKPKPVRPAALRALMSQLLMASQAAI